MRQSYDKEDFDDFDEVGNYINFPNQKFQNFSNSKYSNTSFGVKVSNNNIAKTNKQSVPQSKSKIAKKSDRSIEQKQREPLKSTNQQTNSRKKNQEIKLYGSVIQKVNYPPKAQLENKPTIINSQNQSPKIEKESCVSKSPSLKQCLKTNITNNENKNEKLNSNKNNKNNKNKSNDDTNNDGDNDNLQVIATKFSEFLQEKLNSYKYYEFEKNQKAVTLQEPTILNKNDQAQNAEVDSKRPKLHQSIAQFIEHPEIPQHQNKYSSSIQKQSSDIKPNRKEHIKKEPRSINANNTRKINKNINVTPQKRRTNDFDSNSYSELDSDCDSIDNHYIEPKVPPKPIEHLNIAKKEKELDLKATSSNEKDEANDKSNDQFKELIKRKNELFARINNANEFQKQQEIEFDNHLQIKKSHESIKDKPIEDTDTSNSDSLISRIEQIKSSLLDSTKNSTTTTTQSLSKELPTKTDSGISNNNIISNCNQHDPLSFDPKKTNFDLSGTDSDSDFKSEVDPDKKPNNQLLLQYNDNKNKNEPRSPHVTWDISICPPLRPRVSNNIKINKSFTFINYDELNGYNDEKATEINEINNTKNQIDFNSPENFSKAMKLPKNFLNDFNNEIYNEDDNNLIYETVPNYSRILSILNKVLDESQYKEVVNIMNENKGKHFCLSISTSNYNIEALYLLRSDLQYAKILWGEGLTKVFKEDIEKFFSINIAARRFEPMEISDFACDVDAFTTN